MSRGKGANFEFSAASECAAVFFINFNYNLISLRPRPVYRLPRDILQCRVYTQRRWGSREMHVGNNLTREREPPLVVPHFRRIPRRHVNRSGFIKAAREATGTHNKFRKKSQSRPPQFSAKLSVRTRAHSESAEWRTTRTAALRFYPAKTSAGLIFSRSFRRKADGFPFFNAARSFIRRVGESIARGHLLKRGTRMNAEAEVEYHRVRRDFATVS